MLRLDTFHMISQITKMIMHFIRDQLRKERFELRQIILTVLGNKWNVWDFFLWGSNNTLSGMTGKQVCEFIDIIDEIVKFMTGNFVSTDSQQELVKSLHFLKKICTILKDSVYH